jgi:hypothetical protein
MSAAIVRLIFSVALFAAVLALLAAVFIKLFARRLTFVQALLIAGRSFFLSTLLLVVYTFLTLVLHVPQSVDAISTMVWLAMTGTLITWRARKYGIEKPGWVGIGAKVTLSLLALSWVFVGVYMVVSHTA